MASTLLVIGKKGQLGQSIKMIEHSYPELEICYAGREEIDFEDNLSITNYFNHHRFDCIINAAAYTAVDEAESEPELAEQINHYAVAELAKNAKQQQSRLIHVSTDYVFDGKQNKRYKPTDSTSPQSVYGKSKLMGEQAIQIIRPEGCIVRTSWLYSEFGNNFVKTMLRLGQERDEVKVVDDQMGSPTYAADLAKALLILLNQEQINMTHSGVSVPSVYHFANTGVVSWYELTLAIFELAKIDCKVIPITTDQFPTGAMRPQFSALDVTSYCNQTGVEVSAWKDGLRRCLESLSDLKF